MESTAAAAPEPAAADPDASREVVTRLFAEGFNGDGEPGGAGFKALDALVSPDLVDHHPTGARGRVGMAERLTKLRARFPGAEVTLDHAIAQNDRVMTYSTWTAPRGADTPPLRLFVADLFRIADGQVAEHWDVVDYSGLQPFGIEPQGQEQPSTPADWKIDTAGRDRIRRTLQIWNELYTRHDLTNAPLYFRSDYIQHNLLAAGAGDGRGGFEAFFQILFNAFPDMTADITHIVAEGDLTSVFARWRGVHARTGVKLDLFTADLLRFQDGQVAEHWDVFDYSAVRAFGIEPPTVS